MARFTVFDPKQLQQEIRLSHERSRGYGINPNMVVFPGHVHLGASELGQRLEADADFFFIVMNHLESLYKLFEGADFALGYADFDGYILQMIGDNPILEDLARIKCKPGYRWTEQDVGTSSIALCLARGIPVQITRDECFCARGYRYTNSAAPIFHDNGSQAGVIFITGRADQFHPHTLGMMITAANSIENQQRLRLQSHELTIRNRFMNAVIESIDSGVIATDSNGTINQVNANATRILGFEAAPFGRYVRDLIPEMPGIEDLQAAEGKYIDWECFFKAPSGRNVQAMATIRPIKGPMGNIRGMIVVFHEINRIRKLVNELAGSLARFTFRDIVGSSPSLNEAKNLATKVAGGHSNVLLTGETGTGKELFAQAIHNQSVRKRKPFVAINCSAIPRELLESELFGYAEGSFTGARRGGRPGKFELADGGTVLLDEIGDMPRDMQVKLLRVLQSGEITRIGDSRSIAVNVRIIAATHWDLEREAAKGNFRRDLFYRLNVFPIQIPALRDRQEDIPHLARHILDRCRQAFGKPDVVFSGAAEDLMINYYWPGNVRELENVIERAVNLVEGDLIESVHLAIRAKQPSGVSTERSSKFFLSDVEKSAVAEALQHTRHNIARAARMLGIARPTLYRKIQKYRLTLPEK